MPMASALTFASALTLSLQFLIFAYLYSFHRARFFKYLLIAWGLMSLTKGLHLVRVFVPHLDVLSAAAQRDVLHRHAPRAGGRPGVSHRLPHPASATC